MCLVIQEYYGVISDIQLVTFHYHRLILATYCWNFTRKTNTSFPITPFSNSSSINEPTKMKSKIELLTIIFIMKMAGNSIICVSSSCYLPEIIVFLFIIFQDRIKVSVYYESLCPYSINFIKSKLYPNYQQLRDYIQIEWVPFGKTNVSNISMLIYLA